MDTPRIAPAGETAYLVEFGAAVDVAIMGCVHAARAALLEARLPGVIEAQPTFKSLLVRFDPETADPAALEAELARIADQATTGAAAMTAGRSWTIPVVYGGAHGPELAEVAGLMGLSEAEAAAAHGADELIVGMLGFGAGVAYLAGHGPAWDFPRRATVQGPVPPGAVIVAIRQTVFTPISMPTGWRWIGTSPLIGFDVRRPDPFLLAPGDRVRFCAITPEEAAAFDPEPYWAAP